MFQKAVFKNHVETGEGVQTLMRIAVAIAAAAVFFTASARAEIVRTENVEAELISARSSIAPGETIYIALRKKIRDHWHTYWRNAGDSGEPTEIYWDMPEGFSASGFEWPLPKSLTVGGIITSYGYEGDLVLPLAITAPADMPVGAPVTLTADATWLVCEEVCIPEEAQLSLTLPTASEPGAPDPTWGEAITQTLADIPRPAGFASTISRAGEFVRVSVTDAAIASAIAENAFRAAHFFPFEDDAIDHNAEQMVSLGALGLSLDITPSFGLRDELRPTPGVLAFETLRDGAWTSMGVEIDAAPAATPAEVLDIGATGSALATSAGGGFFSGGGGVFGYLVGAFIGGLILNLMPCVFPVLFIKALGFVQHAHGSSGEVRRHGLMFLAGVLGSFALIGAVLVGLKAA
ncbi:MAG: protein-disulfide reductase DsbD domain-containing protein, partial [Pseudomonadota bacterium]